MNTDDRLDDLDMLSRLPAMAPDASRAERVRVRCHVRLSQKVARAHTRRRLWRRVLTPALVGGFCLVYLALVISAAFGHRT